MAKKKETAELSEFQWKVRDYIAAAYPFLLVETSEDERAVVELFEAVDVINEGTDKKYTLCVWDNASGLEVRKPGSSPVKVKATEELTSAFEALISDYDLGKEGKGGRMCVILRDAHTFITSQATQMVRLMRNLSRLMKIASQTIIFVSPRFDLPIELETEVRKLEFAYPSHAMLARKFSDLASSAGFDASNVAYLDAVVEASSGLTALEAENAFASALISIKRKQGKVVYGQDLIRHIFEEKISTLKNGFLEYVPGTFDFGSVGGLTPVKDWAGERILGFSPEARLLNLPTPRGALIAGIRGCGKTLVAQAIAGHWGFPFYRLDMGKIFGSLVGQTEANMRALIRTMESIGRAVILLDELDKHFNQNAVSGQGDSGTSSRMFGTFLSWLSIKKCPVFIIGTMNNIDALPPELTRKGRFDEVFFVDLPGKTERAEIFNSLLRNKFKSGLRIEVDDSIIPATDGFSGAEIESVIETSVYRLLVNNPKLRELNEGDLEAQLNTTVAVTIPQSKQDEGYVTRMRQKMQKGFRRANDVDQEVSSVGGGRSIALN